MKHLNKRLLSGSLITALLAVLPLVTLAAEPGDLDTSFGKGGIIVMPFKENSSFLTDLAVQKDGKTIAVGYTYELIDGELYINGSVIARFTTTGQPDTSFNGSGVVLLPPSRIDALTIGSDGAIVVAGSMYSNSAGTWVFHIRRFTTNGTADLNVSAPPIGDSGAASVKIQSDRKIVAAGYRRQGSNVDFAIVRYNSDGSLDPSFGNAGVVIAEFGEQNSSAHSLAIQSDHKIIVAGTANHTDPPSSFGILRLNKNGMLDQSFNGTGQVITQVGTSSDAESVVLQKDGKIVVAGRARSGATGFAIVRYDTDGSLDTSFNNTGIVFTPIASASGAFSAAIQADGKIVAAGSCNCGFAMVRYHQNGSLDNSFGVSGVVFTSLGGAIRSVALKPDGRIIAGGTTIQGFILAQYHSVSDSRI